MEPCDKCTINIEQAIGGNNAAKLIAIGLI